MDWLSSPIRSDITEAQNNSSPTAATLLEVAIKEMHPTTAASYRKAFDSFKRVKGVSTISLEDLSQDAVDAWVEQMAIDGLLATTAKYYLDCMGALYGKATAMSGVPAKCMFHGYGDAGIKEDITADCTPLLQLLRNRRTGNTEYQLMLDILEFSQACGGMGLDDIIGLRDDRSEPLPDRAKAIALQYTSPRRLHVFPLSQTRRGAKALRIETGRRIGALLSRNDARVTDYSDNYAAALWLDAALQAGERPSVAKACTPCVPPSATAMQLVRPATLSEEKRRQVLDRVALFINGGRKCWHAMHLRRRTSPAQVLERLNACDLMPEITYYPTDEIVRRVGSSLKKETLAYLPDVLFFKASERDIASMFRTIGDLAWCYRETAAADSAYATISDTQMAAFQRVVGCFTPDIKLLASDIPTLGPGRKVRVTGGLMAGYEGEIFDVCDGSSNSRRMFSVRLLSGYGLSWLASIPDYQITDL